MITQNIDLISLIRTVGRNLETLRKNRELSLENLSVELNIPVKDLKEIETGITPDLKLSAVIAISNYFNCTLQQILDLCIVQVFHHSQNITAGDREVKYENHVKDGYESYITHLKEENIELKRRIEQLLIK